MPKDIVQQQQQRQIVTQHIVRQVWSQCKNLLIPKPFTYLHCVQKLQTEYETHAAHALTRIQWDNLQVLPNGETHDRFNRFIMTKWVCLSVNIQKKRQCQKGIKLRQTCKQYQMTINNMAKERKKEKNEFQFVCAQRQCCPKIYVKLSYSIKIETVFISFLFIYKGIGKVKISYTANDLSWNK